MTGWLVFLLLLIVGLGALAMGAEIVAGIVFFIVTIMAVIEVIRSYR